MTKNNTRPKPHGADGGGTTVPPRIDAEQCRSFFENAIEGFYQSSPEGRFINANPALASLLAYESVPEMINAVTDIAHQVYADPEDRETLKNLLIKNGAVKNHEVQFRTKDGRIIWVMLNIRSVLDDQGTVVYHEGSSQDITARKKAEEALRISEKRFRAIFRKHDAVMLLIEPESGAIIDANHAAQKFYGYSLETFRTLYIQNINTLSEQEIAERRRQAAHESLNYFVFPHRLSNGDIRTVEVHSSPIMVDGQTILFSIIHDITERAWAEEALHRAQKLESLGILAGGIAHNFNNLMGGIYGYIELAGQAASDEKARSYLSKAIATIDQSRDLTRMLITFAKGGAPVLEQAYLFPFLRNTVRFALSGSDVSCVFDIADDLLPCTYDQHQLSSAIANIVINAKQAMPAGGSITVTARNVSFSADTHPVLKKSGYVKISIRDRGTGIPHDVLPRIFDPFFSTKSSGHGLGLATSYSIVKRHEGTIEVESESGRGSTFHIYIPAVPGHGDTLTAAAGGVIPGTPGDSA